jgi:hypothetical protein
LAPAEILLEAQEVPRVVVQEQVQVLRLASTQTILLLIETLLLTNPAVRLQPSVWHLLRPLRQRHR